jgi:hypothetical protein
MNLFDVFLERLQKGNRRIVHNVVAGILEARQEAFVRATFSGGQDRFCLFLTNNGVDLCAELLVFGRELVHGLLKGDRQRLFAQTAAFGVFAVSLAVKEKRSVSTNISID